MIDTTKLEFNLIPGNGKRVEKVKITGQMDQPLTMRHEDGGMECLFGIKSSDKFGKRETICLKLSDEQLERFQEYDDFIKNKFCELSPELTQLVYQSPIKYTEDGDPFLQFKLNGDEEFMLEEADGSINQIIPSEKVKRSVEYGHIISATVRIANSNWRFTVNKEDRFGLALSLEDIIVFQEKKKPEKTFSIIEAFQKKTEEKSTKRTRRS